MSNQIDTKVIIPTYNESDNIDELVQAILGLPVKIGMIIVDDNSPDGTGEKANLWSLKHPEEIHVIHRAGKMGLGTAYIAGFEFALSMPNIRRIMTMDADFSHHPRYIPDIINLSRDKHVVIGSRYVAGGGAVNCTKERILLSQVANLVAKLILGLEAMDTTAGFRLYRREVLESIPLDNIFSSGYSFLVEMLFMCQRRGWQIGEVPIIFEDRRAGTTKISRQEIYKAQYTILRLAARRLLRRAPRQPIEPVVNL